MQINLITSYNTYLRRNKVAGHGLLKKALSVKPSKDVVIWDATGGLLEDSMLMLSYGYNIVTFERNPLMVDLILEAIKNARKDFDFHNILNDRFCFIAKDFRQVVHDGDLLKSNFPDVIYIDPMYPKREKSALGSLKMRQVHQIVGEDLDTFELLVAARKIAKKRVILKRPNWAQIVSDDLAYSYTGKSTRYDLYLPKP